MRQIDSSKVAQKTYKCGKKLKLWQTTQAFVQSWEELSKDNPTMLEIKEKLGDKLYDELFETIITFTLLTYWRERTTKKILPRLSMKFRLK